MPDRVLHVELKLKLECQHYIAINKLMRATVPTIKKKISMITNEKKRIIYYLSQIKGGRKNLDDDLKTWSKQNYKIIVENDLLGIDLANELDQDLFDDLALKNDMSKVKRGFNKRQAHFDYSTTL